MTCYVSSHSVTSEITTSAEKKYIHRSEFLRAGRKLAMCYTDSQDASDREDTEI